MYIIELTISLFLLNKYMLKELIEVGDNCSCTSKKCGQNRMAKLHLLAGYRTFLYSSYTIYM